MKKVLIFIIAALLGLVSCSSCAKKEVLVEPNLPVLDASKDQYSFDSADSMRDPHVYVTGTNWRFTLESDAWIKQELDDDYFYINNQERNYVLFMREPFVGSTQDYALFAIRGIKEAGGRLVSSNPLKVNDNMFISLEMNVGDSTIYQLLLVKDKVAYSMSCGGTNGNSSNQKNICLLVTNSLYIQ